MASGGDDFPSILICLAERESASQRTGSLQLTLQGVPLARLVGVGGLVVNVSRYQVAPVIVLAVLIGLASFAGIADKEGWFDKSFATTNEEAVWFCRALQDAQGESLLITLLDLKGGMKARGWMDADGSFTPKGELSLTAAMEMCPDLYAAQRRKAK